MARILIVDDEESLARIYAHYLRASGHDPVIAPTGHSALSAAQAQPDLILLDLGLPDITGDEVLRRLRRREDTAQIPVMVVSGDPDAAEIVGRVDATGVLGVLQKPLSPSALRAAVGKALLGLPCEADAGPHEITWRGGVPACAQGTVFGQPHQANGPATTGAGFPVRVGQAGNPWSRPATSAD